MHYKKQKHATKPKKWIYVHLVWPFELFINFFFKCGLRLRILRFLFNYFTLGFLVQRHTCLSRTSLLTVLEGHDFPLFYYKITQPKKKKKRGGKRKKYKYVTTTLYCKPTWRWYSLRRLIITYCYIPNVRLDFSIYKCLYYFFHNKQRINSYIYTLHKHAMSLYY